MDFHKWLRTFSLGLISDIATEEAVTLLLSEVQKLRDGQEAMWSAQEETSQKLGRRDPYTFKRKENENQFHFNQDVKDAFVEVSAGLKRVNADDLRERGKLGCRKQRVQLRKTSVLQGSGRY